MELEDLKNIWQRNKGSFIAKDEAQIAAMINGTSKSIISKIKRSVWLELSITFLAGVALLIYALTLPSGALKYTSIAILIVFVCYTVYYIKKLLLLSKYDIANNNIRVNLENLVFKLSGYLKFYKRSYTVLYPVYFSLGVIFSGMEQGTEHFLEVMSQTKMVIYLLLFALVFYVCSTWLVNWLIKNLYGNHLERLEYLLRDLDHDPTENPAP